MLECLEEHQDELISNCQKQIYRLAELSSDDYHLDRPLYYACLDDREKFCAEIASGEGRVYKCLKKHKFEKTMSEEASRPRKYMTSPLLRYSGVFHSLLFMRN